MSEVPNHALNKQLNEHNVVAYIALGANLGNPVQQLDTASLAIQAHPRMQRLKMSKIYRSKPHGPQNQNDYYNAVLQIETTLEPLSLLTELQRIETENGRVRDKTTLRWGPRTLDLDIILYNALTLTSDVLTIPHPMAHCREFVVQPLIDLDDRLHLGERGHVVDLAKQLPIDSMQVIRDVTTYHYKETQRL